jgi:polysaccharide export outer membrane protein
MRLWAAVSCLVVAGGLVQAQTAGAPAPADAAPDYSIGIEDVLRISVWGEAALDLRARVRPDGKVTVPLVNDIKVEGMTPDQVRKEIARRLASYIREPNVTVSVEEINSFRVYVLGEVSRQGPISLFRPTRLLQVISSAGGLTQFAKKEVTVLRAEGDVERRIHVDYKKLLAGDPGQTNLFLKPGDTVLVD